MKKLVIVSALLLGVLCNADTGIIKKIIDGDSIKLTNGTNCRLAYIDTPESTINSRLLKKVSDCKNKNFDVPDYKMVEAGLLSKKYLLTKLSIADEIDYKIVGRDTSFNRDVCEIKKNNLDINLQMVKSGYAYPYFRYIKNESIKREYIIANLDAMASSKGIYGVDKSTMDCMRIGSY